MIKEHYISTHQNLEICVMLNQRWSNRYAHPLIKVNIQEMMFVNKYIPSLEIEHNV